MISRPRDERGVALISVILALALIGALGVAVLAAGSIDFQTTSNHRSATRALMLADAGANHALALLRGPLSRRTYTELLLGADGQPDTDDDGILTGFGLSAADALPDTGIRLNDGRYAVRLVNDPVDPTGDPFDDGNWRMIAECRGQTPDGGLAELRVVLAAPNFPAIATDGDLLLNGNPEILGPCAGLHANNVATAEEIPTVDGPVTAVDTVIVNGIIYDSDGNVVVPRSGEPPMDVPDYNAFDFCGPADYVLRGGWVIDAATGDSSVANGSPQAAGWQFDVSTNTYSVSGNKAVPGTVCAGGNVQVGGNTGSEGSPMQMSILSTGSVEIGGNPKIAASHPEGLLVVAEGDIKVSGIASGVTPNFQGLLYAGSQCKINGTPAVEGYVLCADDPDPLGALNLTDDNIVNGDARITYDCTGVRRLSLISSWWEARAN